MKKSCPNMDNFLVRAMPFMPPNSIMLMLKYILNFLSYPALSLQNGAVYCYQVLGSHGSFDLSYSVADLLKNLRVPSPKNKSTSKAVVFLWINLES